MSPVGFIPLPFQSAQLGRFRLPRRLICPAHLGHVLLSVSGVRKAGSALGKAGSGVTKSFRFRVWNHSKPCSRPQLSVSSSLGQITGAGFGQSILCHKKSSAGPETPQAKPHPRTPVLPRDVLFKSDKHLGYGKFSTWVFLPPRAKSSATEGTPARSMKF